MNIEFHDYIIKVEKSNNLHESIVQHLICQREIPGYEINYFFGDNQEEKVYLEKNESGIRFNIDKNFVIVNNSITFFNLKQHSSVKFKFQIS